ncbi:hypothetical protein P7K49_022787 [Saguinus oedipus]|uniref:Uncharacterized protein n=1 Tax=Saguinus oedipus TaxID=9490 RepID=A0ABQ9UJU4_SAGOE|nr:hypothetical protein P7K49_022787 [Saguinus oedipus]
MPQRGSHTPPSLFNTSPLAPIGPGIYVIAARRTAASSRSLTLTSERSRLERLRQEEVWGGIRPHPSFGGCPSGPAGSIVKLHGGAVRTLKRKSVVAVARKWSGPRRTEGRLCFARGTLSSGERGFRPWGPPAGPETQAPNARPCPRSARGPAPGQGSCRRVGPVPAGAEFLCGIQWKAGRSPLRRH